MTEAKTALNNQLMHKAENNEIILAEYFNAKIAISTKNCKPMRITKRQTTPKNHCRQKHDSSKPQSRYRHLDPGEQEEKLGKISHWLYISHTLYNQRNTNPHSGRRRASHSERGNRNRPQHHHDDHKNKWHKKAKMPREMDGTNSTKSPT